MTDTKLRELERRFRASGSVEAEAAWLLGRLRSGELSQEEIDLAAYCWHEAARTVVGDPKGEVDLVTRLRDLEDISPEALTRGRLAIGLRAADLWSAGGGAPPLDELVHLSEEWVTGPSRRHQREIKQAVYDLVSHLHLHLISRLPTRQAQAMLQIVLGTACRVAGVPQHGIELPGGFSSFGTRSQDYNGVLEFVAASLRIMSEAELRVAVADSICPCVTRHVEGCAPA